MFSEHGVQGEFYVAHRRRRTAAVHRLDRRSLMKGDAVRVITLWLYFPTNGVKGTARGSGGQPLVGGMWQTSVTEVAESSQFSKLYLNHSRLTGCIT